MNRTFSYHITSEHSGLKLHEYLSSLGYPSSILTKLRQDCSLSLINGAPSFLNTILCKDDNVSITLCEERASLKIPPVKLPFNIVYEDEDIVVINKPAKMPIHPSLNNYENTLGNAAAYYFKDEPSPFVYRCINRLDRDTTGLTIIAKNMLSGAILANKGSYSSIKKTYYAIVANAKSLPSAGTINSPIGRKADSTIERQIDFENGESAVTHFSVIDKLDDLALVQLNLETGRTHQIRVHMKSIGHPLIGDFLYNPLDNTMNRQALHVGNITFIHPIKKEMLSLKASLPDDMKLLFPNVII